MRAKTDAVLKTLGPAIFTVGVIFALLLNIRVGAVTMGLGIGAHLLGEGISMGAKGIWRRPVAVVIPLVIAVALVTVALLLPRSSL